MSDAHIRDFLAQTKEDLKEGKPSCWTLCGLQDKKYELTFGQAQSIIRDMVKYPCRKCKQKYLNEKNSMNAQKVAINKFRLIVSKLHSFRR